MKIVHLCLACFFPDNYSYQENMLPKFHKKLGFDVEVIASLETFDKDGKPTYMSKAETYKNEYAIKVTRLAYKKPEKVYKKLKRYIGTYHAIDAAKPDILFIHGCQFQDMDIVVRYLKKHTGVKVYVDHHADFSNSARNWLSKNILHKGLWRKTAHMVEPFTTKFYGVLPARVEFLKNIYKLPEKKCELLVMGADDEAVQQALSEQSRQSFRSKYGIKQDDFLIVTGGKIDSFKRQTLLLMEAVHNIQNAKLKLIVFGSVQKDIQPRLEKLCDSRRVQYIGWAKGDQSYEFMGAADLVVFPGRHSVYWEQAAGLGIPMLCKYWEGTTHVDCGGNVRFLKEDTVEEIQGNIQRLLDNPDEYERMLLAAQGNGKSVFSYKEIAKRSIRV